MELTLKIENKAGLHARPAALFAKKASGFKSTIMIQQILSQKKWKDVLTPEDYRALTPLIYAHINPYGHFNLNMNERIIIEV